MDVSEEYVYSCYARELERELNEQCRLNGKGSEREAALLGKVERLERENARLLELITLLEVAGEGMSEECASQPHVAKWDAARGEVGSFLRSA